MFCNLVFKTLTISILQRNLSFFKTQYVYSIFLYSSEKPDFSLEVRQRMAMFTDYIDNHIMCTFKQ